MSFYGSSEPAARLKQEIAEGLRAFMAEYNISEGELAARLGFDLYRVQAMLAGGFNFTTDELAKVYTALGVWPDIELIPVRSGQADDRLSQAAAAARQEKRSNYEAARAAVLQILRSGKPYDSLMALVALRASVSLSDAQWTITTMVTTGELRRVGLGFVLAEQLVTRPPVIVRDETGTHLAGEH